MIRSFERTAQAVADRIGVEPANFAGICLALLASLTLMINGAIGKILGGEMDPFLVAFFRSAIMVIILVPWFTRHGYSRIKPTRHRDQMINGVIFTAAFAGWFWALPRVPLDMVAAIGFTSQLYAVVGAILFLGEKSKAWRWGALLIGLAGALVIVRPGFVEITPGILVLVFTAIMFSTNRLIIKVLATKDNPETSVVWMAVWATILLSPVAALNWGMPTLTQSVLLVSIALLTIVSHYSLAWALRLGDIGAIEPTVFTRLIWGALFGFMLFGAIPDVFTIVGGLIVFCSVVYIARRERREGKEEMAQKARAEGAEK